MDKIISNYIKYKFLFNNINHSSYLYQKVFRSIYGYTQNVTKKDGKVYQYRRKGIVEELPYLRPGKNSIIIPINTEHKLINFFNTGKSLIHNFKEKGDYIVDYSIDKIEINTIDIIKCLEEYIDYYYIISINGKRIKLIDELNLLINDIDYLKNYKKSNINNILKKIEFILSIDWFIKCKNSSEKIKEFIEKIEIFKNKIIPTNIENNIDEKENYDVEKNNNDLKIDDVKKDAINKIDNNDNI